MVADATHSLSDLLTDFAVLLGLRYTSKPADDDNVVDAEVKEVKKG